MLVVDTSQCKGRESLSRSPDPKILPFFHLTDQSQSELELKHVRSCWLKYKKVLVIRQYKLSTIMINCQGCQITRYSTNQHVWNQELMNLQRRSTSIHACLLLNWPIFPLSLLVRLDLHIKTFSGLPEKDFFQTRRSSWHWTNSVKVLKGNTNFWHLFNRPIFFGD